MCASLKGHVGVVHWLLGKGSSMMLGIPSSGCVVLRPRPVLRLLVGKAAEPTIVDDRGWAPLRAASDLGYLEVVGLLLCKASARTNRNHRAGVGVLLGHPQCRLVVTSR
jgi:hypothetical protein